MSDLDPAAGEWQRADHAAKHEGDLPRYILPCDGPDVGGRAVAPSRPKVNGEIERLVREHWNADGSPPLGDSLARGDLIRALQAHSDATVEAVLREREESPTRRNRSALVAAAARALEVLDRFIDEHDDPGSEAFGARHELNAALQPFGRPAEPIRVAETALRQQIAEEIRKLPVDGFGQQAFTDLHGIDLPLSLERHAVMTFARERIAAEVIAAASPEGNPDR